MLLMLPLAHTNSAKNAYEEMQSPRIDLVETTHEEMHPSLVNLAHEEMQSPRIDLVIANEEMPSPRIDLVIANEEMQPSYVAEYELLYKQFETWIVKCFRCSNTKDLNLLDSIKFKYTCKNTHDCFIRFMENTESIPCNELISNCGDRCNNIGKKRVTIQDFIENKHFGYICEQCYY